MSRAVRLTSIAPLGISLFLSAGCGRQTGNATTAGTFVVPPVGVTGTPADEVTDPALGNLPNPNQHVITNWGRLPGGRVWDNSASVDIGPDGHVWAYDRCGGNCDRNSVDTIFKFDRGTGKVLVSFGAGVLVAPHGLHLDRQGNVWVTDFLANDARTKGHQVFKFSPGGTILMRLGEAGVSGDGPGQFNQPTDVITAANGDIFVADGHNGADTRPPPGATGRILKFSADGRFIKQWGRIGNAPGEFRTPHGLAFDSQGRLFVADRGNHRIQIFDQEGTYVDSYYRFGRVSGLFITPEDALYAIDSESDEKNHPGWRRGIRIGKTSRDVVTSFIPPHVSKDKPAGVAGEAVAVDDQGNVYVAEGPDSRPALDGALTKYLARR